MLFYILLLLVIILLAGRYNIAGYHIIRPKSGFIIAYIIIAIISFFRFDMGWDYSIYYSFMYPSFKEDLIKQYNFGSVSDAFFSISKFFNAPVLYFVLYGIITYSLIFYIINIYSASRYESLIIYLAVFYLSSWGIIRQCAASSVLFLGYKYIKEKKFFSYVFICIMACFFHKSAIVGLLFYPLYYIKYSLTIFVSIVLCIALPSLLPILMEIFGFSSYLHYLNNFNIINHGGGFVRCFYLALLFYCLVILACSKSFKTKFFKENEGLLSIVTVGQVFPYLLGSHIGGRLAEYSMLFFVLLIPKINVKLSIHKRTVIMIVFYLYFLLYLLTTSHISMSKEYVPYRFYFFTNRNIMDTK